MIKANPLLKFIKLSFFRRYTTEKVSFTPVLSMDLDNSLEKLAEIISLSKSFTQQQGAKFYFVYIPDLKLKNYEKVINIIKNLDIPIIDIYKELHLTLEDPMALYPFGLKDQHYNELGYGLIAETILNKIDEYDRLEKE